MCHSTAICQKSIWPKIHNDKYHQNLYNLKCILFTALWHSEIYRICKTNDTDSQMHTDLNERVQALECVHVWASACALNRQIVALMASWLLLMD